MTREEIEAAAVDYYGKQRDCPAMDCTCLEMDAFRAGAEWAYAQGKREGIEAAAKEVDSISLQINGTPFSLERLSERIRALLGESK